MRMHLRTLLIAAAQEEVLRVPEVKSASRFAQQNSHLLLRQVALLFT